MPPPSLPYFRARTSPPASEAALVEYVSWQRNGKKISEFKKSGAPCALAPGRALRLCPVGEGSVATEGVASLLAAPPAGGVLAAGPCDLATWGACYCGGTTGVPWPSTNAKPQTRASRLCEGLTRSG